MREVLIVLEREFLARVRSRSFLLSTLILPLFTAGVFGLPTLAQRMSGSDSQRIAVLDESPEGVGMQVVAALRGEGGGTKLQADYVRGGRPGVADSLGAEVRAEALDAYLRIPADVVESSRAELVSRPGPNRELRARLGGALSGAVQAQRVAAAGLRSPELAALLRPVRIEERTAAGSGEAPRSTAFATGASMLTIFVLYFLLVLYGVQVLQSVQEEKTNRIAEVLMASIRARDLLFGKLLGVGASALLQVGIWVALAALVLRSRAGAALPGGAGLAPGFDASGVRAMGLTLAVSALFALLGFFFYAGLFAAAGAAADSVEDAQRFNFPIMLPLLVPVLLVESIIRSPNGTLARLLSLFPPTAPVVMPARVGAGVPWHEVLLSLVLLAAAVFGAVALAGRIYRIGLLSTGKRPSLRELARWLRSA